MSSSRLLRSFILYYFLFPKIELSLQVERSKTTGQYFLICCIFILPSYIFILSSYLGMFFRLDNDVIIPIISFVIVQSMICLSFFF